MTWHEIAKLKRPSGIPLGDDHYLKEIGVGQVFLTDKQVTMIGTLGSKKFTLLSVQRVVRFADGILFNRSTGKSVFLKAAMEVVEPACFALIAEHACSGVPVLGTVPTENFVPEVLTAELMIEHDTVRKTTSHDGPRYKFRVVGDFVGRRQDYIARLRVGEPIQLIREPANEYDENAVRSTTDPNTNSVLKARGRPLVRTDHGSRHTGRLHRSLHHTRRFTNRSGGPLACLFDVEKSILWLK